VIDVRITTLSGKGPNEVALEQLLKNWIRIAEHALERVKESSRLGDASVGE